jgi:hypothetical protein
VNPDLALAQAGTMRVWAQEWERKAIADPVIHAGYGEVALLLRRAADQAAKAVGPAIRHDMIAEPSAKPVFVDHGIAPTPNTEYVRPDEEADG